MISKGAREKEIRGPPCCLDSLLCAFRGFWRFCGSEGWAAQMLLLASGRMRERQTDTESMWLF